MVRFAMIVLACSVATSSVLASAGPPREGEFIKNNLPCFADICIGDRVEDLGSFKFQALPPSPRRSDSERLPLFEESFRRIYGFWDPGLFVSPMHFWISPRLVETSSRFSDLCPSDFLDNSDRGLRSALQATSLYRTDSGHETYVTVRLLPDPADPQLKTGFFVTRIDRYVEVPDPGERERILQQVDQRYAPFTFRGRGPKVDTKPWPNASVVAIAKASQSVGRVQPGSPGSGGAGVSIKLEVSGDPMHSAGTLDGLWRKLARHPRCTTSTTRSID